MVTTFYPPRSFGGDAVAVQSLARALVRGGHHVTVVCDDDAYRTLSGNHDPIPPEHDDGVVVHRFASRLGAIAVGLTQQTGRPLVHGAALRRLLDDGERDRRARIALERAGRLTWRASARATLAALHDVASLARRTAPVPAVS